MFDEAGLRVAHGGGRGGGSAEQAAIPSPEEIAPKFPQFEILGCLGRGGMGVVYQARQKSLNRMVAIKILAPERERDSAFAARFAQEAELLAKLNHPSIVTVHDFGEVDGLYFLVMEFVDGVNLRKLLEGKGMTPEEALAIVPSICDALQSAHEHGVVHRDIKPENILLDKDGRVKIADFGIAVLVGTSPGGSAGTPHYMAPEQSGRSKKADHRADIYSLGVVFYEMLTGERPDKTLVVPSKRIEVDVRVDEIVLRALEKEPEKRYQTAGEFRTVVETVKDAPEVPPAEGGKRDGGRRSWWTPAKVGVVAVGGCLLAPLAVLLTVFAIGLLTSYSPKEAEVARVEFSPLLTTREGFGPVLERELVANQSLQDCFFDVETGKVMGVPEELLRDLEAQGRTGKMRSQVMVISDWARREGVDFWLRSGEDSLIVLEGMVTLTEKSSDPLSSDAVLKVSGLIFEAQNPIVEPGFHTACQFDQPSPYGDQWVFRTREGSSGVLQMADQGGAPRRVKIWCQVVDGPGIGESEVQ